MTTSHSTLTTVAGATPPATIKVWDLFIRVFHWSLVALFATAYLTGDEIERVHIAAGYAIAGLLVLRIVWGFIGPPHARFANFVRSPRAAVGYLRAAVRLQPRRYIGHNPAGALMVVTLISMLAMTCVTGYLMTTDAYWGSKLVEDVHGALANGTVALVVLHVLGVLAASLEHRENLAKSMFTGRKRAS